MRPLVFLLFLLLPGFAQPAPQTDAIQPKAPLPLFNGKNLDGWYTWLRDYRYEDPHRVFSVVDGNLRISGEDWGGIATKQAYRDYHLIVEWKWGGKTWGDREKKARDSGILIHAVGIDGEPNKIWLESIESQIIEGGTGDIILVAGKNKPSLTMETRALGKELYWHTGGEVVTRDSGRFDWWGRSPEWRDEINFRGPKDVEKPVGEWNRHEIIADGDKVTCILNGVVVIHGYGASHRAGKIQIQSEGAEILIRKVELRPIGKRPKAVSPAVN
jgi:hypothetical protein